MITKVECFMLECDNCKEPYENYNGFSIFPDENAAKEYASDDGWFMHSDDDKHYCDQCHTINDNDELVIKTERFNPTP